MKKLLCFVSALACLTASFTLAGCGEKVDERLKFSTVDGGYCVSEIREATTDDLTKTTIKVPEKYEGEPVVSIAVDAFQNGSYLKEIQLPSTIRSLSSGAFKGCASLTTINVPESVETISYGAFKDCTSLTTISIPESVETIAYNAFDGCTALQYEIYENGKYLGNADNPHYALLTTTTKRFTDFTIHENTKIIVGKALEDCSFTTTEQKTVTIPDGVKTIGERAFFGVYGSIVDGINFNCINYVIPDSVLSIENNAFRDYKQSRCGHSKIFYEGSKEDWQQIEVEDSGCWECESYADAIGFCLTFFYSETDPDGYRAWHYDDNGTIEIW